MDLKKWIEVQGWTITEFAKRLEVSRCSVYKWFNHQKPSKRLAKRLAKLTNNKIKSSNWD